MSDESDDPLSDMFLEHAAKTPSQYDSLCRQMAAEILRLRHARKPSASEPAEAFIDRMCDTGIISSAQGAEFEQAIEQRDSALASAAERRGYERGVREAAAIGHQCMMLAYVPPAQAAIADYNHRILSLLSKGGSAQAGDPLREQCEAKTSVESPQRLRQSERPPLDVNVNEGSGASPTPKPAQPPVDSLRSLSGDALEKAIASVDTAAIEAAFERAGKDRVRAYRTQSQPFMDPEPCNHGGLVDAAVARAKAEIAEAARRAATDREDEGGWAMFALAEELERK